MMNRKMTVTLLLLFFLLVACQPRESDATATPETAAPVDTAVPPTEEPVVDPTEDVSETEVEIEMADLGALVAQPWQWVSFTDPVESFEVDIPNNYVATFNEDGSINLVADCNNAAGEYTTEESALTITVGPSTMALCPPESRSEQFIQLLGGAAIYFFEEGDLYIDLMADGGTMAFTPASAEAMADDGEGAKVDTADEQPFGAGIFWQLSSFTDPVLAHSQASQAS